MPLFFTFLFIFNTIHYYNTLHISSDEAGVIWEEPAVYTVLFTQHAAAVMRLGQAGFMRGSSGFLRLQSVAEIL